MAPSFASRGRRCHRVGEASPHCRALRRPSASRLDRIPILVLPRRGNGTLGPFVSRVITNSSTRGTGLVRLVQCVSPGAQERAWERAESVTACRMHFSASSSVNQAQQSVSGRGTVTAGDRGFGRPRAPHPSLLGDRDPCHGGPCG